jgi:hypothetical protein
MEVGVNKKRIDDLWPSTLQISVNPRNDYFFGGAGGTGGATGPPSDPTPAGLMSGADIGPFGGVAPLLAPVSQPVRTKDNATSATIDMHVERRIMVLPVEREESGSGTREKVADPPS